MNNELRIMDEKIRTFKDLNARKEGHKLVIMIYEVTKSFPKEEMFGITSQMRRCAVSITSNIAEGFSRQSYKEKTHFYSMAQGSLTELQSQTLVAKDIGYITKEQYDELESQSVVAHKIISGLIRSSKSKTHNP